VRHPRPLVNRRDLLPPTHEHRCAFGRPGRSVTAADSTSCGQPTGDGSYFEVACRKHAGGRPGQPWLDRIDDSRPVDRLPETPKSRLNASAHHGPVRSSPDV